MGDWASRNREGLTLFTNRGFGRYLGLTILVSALHLFTVFSNRTSFAATTEGLRVGIIEYADRFTHVQGLGDCLTSAGVAYRDLSEDAAHGQLDLRGLELLIVGSFVTENRTIRETLTKSRHTIHAFVLEGGTVAVLSQADQTVTDEPWLEPSARITRCDQDYSLPVLLHPGHPLFNSPEKIGGSFADWRGLPFSWESIVDHLGVAVLAAQRSDGRHPCIVEAAWGRGRGLVLTIPFDKAFLRGNAAARRIAVALARNLCAYAGLVKAGQAPPVSVFVPPGAYRHPIGGVVFRDDNGNAVRDPGEPILPGVGVSDGYEIVLTNKEGNYRLANVAREARFVFVTVPAGYRKGGRYWQRLEAGETPRLFDFGLVPAERAGDHFRFVHLGDTHIPRRGTIGWLGEVLREIGRLDDPPLFIVESGDLVENGQEAKSYAEYLGVVRKSPVPVLPVAGNHDVLRDPTNYQEAMGPEYYSFDEGRYHFIVMTDFDKSARYQRWLERDRALLANGKPLILFQHYEPRGEQYETFASWGARLLCHSHWHGNRVVTCDGMTVLSTPTPLFGGIDGSPPAFHVIEVDGERLSALRRLSFQDRRLTIVSPSEDLVQSGPKLQIIANAYDTSRPPKSGGFELKRGTQTLARVPLQPDGEWSWCGQADAGSLAPGPYEAIVSVTDSAQRTWTTRRLFHLSAGEAPRPRAGSEDWPTFLGNAERNRRPAAVVRPPLALAWAASIGEPSEYSAPVLSQGTIFVSLRNRGFPGGNGVLALDALTGARKWFAPTESAVHNSVAVDSDTVYASSVGGRTYAFDLRNGREKWHVDHGSSYERWVYPAPLVFTDRLIAGNAAHLSSIDRATGRETWHAAFHTDWMPAFGSFAASGRILLACANWSKVGLVAFDTQTGRQLWEHGVYGCMGTPVIVGRRVFVADVSGTIWCRNLADGKPLWERELKTLPRQSPATVSSPAVADDRVIVAADKVFALDYRDGHVLWEFSPDPPGEGYDHREMNLFFSSPVISDDLVWIGSGAGYLYALDVTTGRRVARIEFGVPVLSTPLLWGNSIYVATYDGHLYCLTQL